ncbi:glucokinase [Allomyces javanicus]|nr:glucokinase [Allomyces javanicus]
MASPSSAAGAAATAAAVAQPALPTTNADKIYSDVLASFQIPRDKMRLIATHMYSEFVRGLSADGAPIRMIPSYAYAMPTSHETGVYLALDLGGTNFRVCAVTLKGHGQFDVVADKFTIPDSAKVGPGAALFDFIAGAVEQFVHSHDLSAVAASSATGELTMGFTFSFPVKQESIARGALMYWAKGFDCPDVVGQDVVDLLQVALARRAVKVRVVALVNDTVGTLVAHAYQAPATVMGCILGTGTNAAYIEQLAQVTKYRGTPTPTGTMLINTEWGAFDSEGKVLPLTQFDRELDAMTNNGKQQVFEKLISGMYLGEITRRALVHLVEAGALFGGKLSTPLQTVYAFETAYMSTIEADTSPALTAVGQVLAEHLAVASTTLTDRQLVKSLVQQIGTRAARLSAVGIFALLEKMGVPESKPVVVAVDGSVWLKYPGFQDRLRAALRELMGPEKAALVSVETAHDGSGTGAALIAALVDKQH